MTLTHNPNYANLWPRLAANRIHTQLFWAIGLISLQPLVNSYIIKNLVTSLIMTGLAVGLPLAMANLIYRLVAYTRFATTLGKAIFGIKIYKQAKPLTLTQTILREYCFKPVSSVFGLGHLAALVHPDHQMWHDQFADTKAHQDPGRSPIFGYLLALGLLALNGYLISQLYFGLTTNMSLVTHFNHLLTDVKTITDSLTSELKF